MPTVPCLSFDERVRAAHPPTQEATAVKLWRNAQRVSSEALAKEDTLPAFVASLATSAE
jgi:hypothetical protein